MTLSAQHGSVKPNGLPTTTLKRWQVLRSGVLQLFRFDEQEFWYERGRLLLRGNNGTGKSRVLALQLPFLLDGDIASHRVEPDRDPAKRMEWNLLLGKHKDRRGYTWIEFGRIEGGVERFLTLGCGLQAVEGRGITGRWFFVSSRRVGQDLRLQTDARQPLTREQLSAQLGEDGKVFTTAQEYRREVDAALFGLGAQRYEALIDLLITLRQPQLSRSLDEGALSKALSDALPPLSQKIIDDVAESMRGLELDREQLESHRASAQAIKAFLSTYVRYARTASRRRADVVRQAHAKFETTGRQLRASEADVERLSGEAEAIDTDLARLRLSKAEAEAAHETLLSSPQMAAARELDDARRDASDRRVDSVQAREDETQAAAQLRGVQEAVGASERRLAGARQSSTRALAHAASGAELIGMRLVHQRVLGSDDLADPREEKFVDAAKAAISKAIETRRAETRRLKAVVAAAEVASEVLDRAKTECDRTAADVAKAEEAATLAGSRITSCVDEVVVAYQKWCEESVEIRPESTLALAELVNDWVQVGVGDSPIGTSARAAITKATDRLALLEADLKVRIDAVRVELADLEAKRAEALEGKHEPPPAPYTRSAESRVNRPGAPFWALCEFCDGVPEAHRAGLEAALEAAGILDAWVLPSGELVDAGTQDVLLTPSDEATSERDCLAALLRPAPTAKDSPITVSDGVVWSILRSIGTRSGTSGIYMGTDGSWQNGPLSGRWLKPSAQHLGATTREAARVRRLAVLEQNIDGVRRQEEAMKAEGRHLDNRRRSAAVEAANAPRDDRIRDALAAHSQARRSLDDSRVRLRQAELAVIRTREVRDTVVGERDQTARDLDLAQWLSRVNDLEEAITQYRDACTEVFPALLRHADALDQADAVRGRLHQGEAMVADRRARALQASEKAQVAQTRYEVLERTKGAAIRDVIDQLEWAKKTLTESRAAENAAIERRTATAVRLAQCTERTSELRGQRLELERVRDEAVEGYRRFVGTGVLAVAVPDKYSLAVADWSTTRLVELARDSDQELVSVPGDDASWERQQNQLFEQFKTLEDTLLPHDHRPEMRPEADVMVIRAVFQGRPCAIDELHKALEEEVTQRQLLLDSKEREVLENHLIGEVARYLHDQLHFAANLVHQMNKELERIPTSSGMVLRFRWEPKEDGPAGLAETRRRLLGAVGTWSPDEREGVGRFLQECIRSARLANDTASWQEQLTTALDYRAWHDFIIERNTDGQWRRLTRRTHGTGSGGEKAVALMIPMFAAAASHYRSAAATAPRLILLDEAFAGVDAEMRGKCMGLLGTFDLDFIMTSDREWCCYSTLPGVAICQLSARPRVDGVYVSRWVWTGKERVEAPLENGAWAAPHVAVSGNGETRVNGDSG